MDIIRSSKQLIRVCVCAGWGGGRVDMSQWRKSGVIQSSQVRVVTGMQCCFLEQDILSSLLSTGSTQENVPT